MRKRKQAPGTPVGKSLTEENSMLPGTNSASRENVPRLTAQNFLICVLTVGLCMLTFAMPAHANDNAVRAYQVPATTKLNTISIPSLTVEQPAPHPRWSLLPKDFAQTPNPALSNFPPMLSASAEPTDPTNYLLPRPAPAAAFVADAAAGSSSGSGHGHWLLLGIYGVVVAGVGTLLYAGSRIGFVCAAPDPSSGCNEAKTAGLVLIPVGAVMAVTGFVMRFRH